ncbi:MAG: FHA domain-containing protein [Anaerolineae bacterium]|nr:FHA domain-containing protein [Anaerolineae bacterium]
MSTVASIPGETQQVLLHLLATNLKSARTLPSLRNLCPGSHQIDEAVAWLVDSGYAYDDGDTFELSVAGLQLARKLQTVAQSQRLGIPQDMMSITPSPQTQALPTLETHPLRMGADHPHHPGSEQQETLRYVLASEQPRNLLPIPVLNGDVLGRLADVDISLPCDEYVSSEHCRFTFGVEDKRSNLYIEDLGSRNGTLVNGFRLEAGQQFSLEHGDRIQVGSTILIVVRIPT